MLPELKMRTENCTLNLAVRGHPEWFLHSGRVEARSWGCMKEIDQRKDWRSLKKKEEREDDLWSQIAKSVETKDFRVIGATR